MTDQYATEGNLRARQAIYANTEGDDPRDVAFEAVRATSPRDVVEVGGGPGEFAARIRNELAARVSFVDVSPRMVELARERGLDARVGDVQELPFEDETFDCAVAAWMLYHVPDLDRGLAELGRVLRPGAHLVATTNSGLHLYELQELFPRQWESTFTRENGAQVLERHFASVERIDVDGWVTIETREAVLAYRDSVLTPAEQPPDIAFDVPLRVRRCSTVFVAERPT